MNEVTRPFSLYNVQHLLWISNSARRNGIHILGGPGSGKSRLMGRQVAYLDFLRGIPLILLDPTGGTWSNFADRIMRLSEVEQPRAWKRVVYVDMSGVGSHAVSMPLLYKLQENESAYTSAQRFLEVIRRMDPALSQASVEGMNALTRLWIYSSMILSTLGYQVTEIESLLRTPGLWRDRMSRALYENPEVRPAVDFFNDYMNWSPDLQARRADSLLIKLMPFQVDPGMKAMFGASNWGFQWSEIVENRKALILDFSRELNPERRRFKLLWCFLSFVEYLKSRGIEGRARPVSFIIDEVTQLTGYGKAEQSLLLVDLEELVSVIARNMGIWLCIAHQSLAQIDDRLVNVLMQMGTQLIGVMPNPEDAHYLARQFTQYEPMRLKKREPIWMGVTDPNVLFAVSQPTVIDWRTVEYSSDEQLLLTANMFRTLGRFQFLARVAREEGNMTGALRLMSIASIDRGLYPDPAMVAELNKRLLRRDGRPLPELLSEIESRLSHQSFSQMHTLLDAKMKAYAHDIQTSPQEEDEDDIESFRTKE